MVEVGVAVTGTHQPSFQVLAEVFTHRVVRFWAGGGGGRRGGVAGGRGRCCGRRGNRGEGGVEEVGGDWEVLRSGRGIWRCCVGGGERRVLQGTDKRVLWGRQEGIVMGEDRVGKQGEGCERTREKAGRKS